jgi:hypothetical protein
LLNLASLRFFHFLLLWPPVTVSRASYLLFYLLTSESKNQKGQLEQDGKALTPLTALT